MESTAPYQATNADDRKQSNPIHKVPSAEFDLLVLVLSKQAVSGAENRLYNTQGFLAGCNET